MEALCYSLGLLEQEEVVEASQQVDQILEVEGASLLEVLRTLAGEEVGPLLLVVGEDHRLVEEVGQHLALEVEEGYCCLVAEAHWIQEVEVVLHQLEVVHQQPKATEAKQLALALRPIPTVQVFVQVLMELYLQRSLVASS